MKRKDLEALGMDKEVIDKVMTLHQTDVEENKKVLDAKDEEIQKAQGGLTSANDTIKELQEQVKQFDGVDVNKLKADFEEKESNYKDQLLNQEKDFAIDKLFAQQGFVSELAKKGAINEFKEKNLTYENGSFLGADEYFGKLKESDPTAFEVKDDDSESKKQKGTFTTGFTHDGDIVDELDAKMDAVLGLSSDEGGN